MPVPKIIDRNGISPELSDEIILRDKAMSGDLVFAITPVTIGTSAATDNAAIVGANLKYNRTISMSLKTVGGQLHDWFCGTLTIAATKTSTAGVIAIEGGASTVTFVNGVASCQLKYTGTWAAADIATLTVTGQVLSKAINVTSTDTLVA